MKNRERMAVGTAFTIGATLAAGATAEAQDFTVTGLGDASVEGTLRKAINDANSTAGEDRILFQSGLSGSINLGGPLPDITEELEIVGPGPDVLTVNGLYIGNNFAADADASISGLRVINGDQAAGSAIRGSQGIDLDIDNMVFENNAASGRGGAVYTRDGTLDLTNSTFSGNTAVLDGGGALFSYGTEVQISGTTFTNNAAVAGGAVGGAVLIMGNRADTTIGGSTFTRNVADTAGGGLHAVGPLQITDSEFRGNSSYVTGGGLRSIGPTTISGSLFAENTATVRGGGLDLGGITMDLNQRVPSSITNSTITGNQVDQAGAGIFSTRSSVDIASSTITGNTVVSPTPAPRYGGGGFFQDFGTINLTNSVVSANSPTDMVTVAQPPGPVSPMAGTVNSAFSLTGPTAGATFNETVPGSNISSSDPQLGPLADSGGPTETMLPAESSPVVNKGSSALTVDQRGLVRPVDFNSIPFSTAAGANGADIGAVELQGGPLPPPPTCETDPSLCPPPPDPPSNNFTFGKVKLNKKKGVATVQVKVPGAGKVLLIGSKTVAKASKSAKAKATLSLTVKTKGKAAKQLKKKGKAKVKASFRFTPSGGTAKTKSKTVKLVKKQAKKKK
ncbi:MAG: choice-of-anchor Q domain-containing protein [Solirubrobacterales bacterium]